MDELLKWSELISNFMAAGGSVVVIGLLGFAAKYLWDQLRWRSFAKQVQLWAREDFRALDPDESQLAGMVSNWLSDAGFTPKECKELLEFATTFARARIDYVHERE